MSSNAVFLCPGQGAQTVGMGKAWAEASAAAASVLSTADEVIEFPAHGSRRLSEFCFDGPQEDLNRTDVSQPALFACGIACHAGLSERHPGVNTIATAGLSLGEYTALCLAGAFSFADGLRLVATRGRLMQAAAEASQGGMVALIGADEAQAAALCADAAQGDVLVPANYNAPGQIVVSGSASACDRAVEVASKMGLRASRLQVAGAFHSPLMVPAAEGMARAMEHIEFRPLQVDVWSNVTGQRHARNDSTGLKKLLVEQITSPVRWAQSCADMIPAVRTASDVIFHELAPNTVLKGLMRRIDRSVEVSTHDQPPTVAEAAGPSSQGA
ncbi:MAG: ACP S-malonyltransferase [Phycisphaerae bacterium]|nr:ACP S-malonyltransferase [Phycisphaerae bacterium]